MAAPAPDRWDRRGQRDRWDLQDLLAVAAPPGHPDRKGRTAPQDLPARLERRARLVLPGQQDPPERWDQLDPPDQQGPPDRQDLMDQLDRADRKVAWDQQDPLDPQGRPDPQDLRALMALLELSDRKVASAQ